MPEKAYQTMKHAGAWGIVMGVLLMIAGITIGVMSIIYGGKLLKNKSEIIF
ncbi:MAG: hypothetical protein K2G89_07830 [Lachnospiraceae bacterium]|nr:hypothetical protein [Lachnospiraceae bacterium]